MLSSVRVPLAEIGRRAVRLLHEQLQAPTPPETVVLPTAMEIRESTAPPCEPRSYRAMAGAVASVV